MNAAPPKQSARDVRLLPFTPADLERLRQWLPLPHVQRWWGDPADALGVAARLPEGYQHTIIAVDDEPVGYLRWSKKSKETLIAVGLADLPDGTVDIDLFLGPREVLGHGIGTQALALLRDQLLAEQVPCMGLVTSVHNQRAIASYEKVGFVRDREFQDTTFGECWVMLYPVDG